MYRRLGFLGTFVERRCWKWARRGFCVDSAVSLRQQAMWETNTPGVFEKLRPQVRDALMRAMSLQDNLCDNYTLNRKLRDSLHDMDRAFRVGGSTLIRLATQASLIVYN